MSELPGPVATEHCFGSDVRHGGDEPFAMLTAGRSSEDIRSLSRPYPWRFTCAFS